MGRGDVRWTIPQPRKWRAGTRRALGGVAAREDGWSKCGVRVAAHAGDTGAARSWWNGRVFHSRGARPGKSVIGPRAAREMGAFALGQSAMGKETVVTWLLFRSGLTFELSRMGTAKWEYGKQRCGDHFGLNEKLGLTQALDCQWHGDFRRHRG